jgi:GNAT superfamily N-acetyltransferase
MIRRVLRTWADDATAFGIELARIDPSWGSETFELGGGRVVLCGRGMYVNRALAVGWEGSLTELDLDHLEARCRVIGVPPAVELSPETDPAVRRQLARRGYRPDGTTTALVRRLDHVDEDSDAKSDGSIVIRHANTDLLGTWQATSALGWGHVDEQARHASDVFARVAAAIDGEGMVLASDASGDRPIGCASMTVRDGVATLGGMSTLPTERRRGVQAALIRYRLASARERGCEIATSSARSGGASERNLIRHGFRPWFTITTLTRRT